VSDTATGAGVVGDIGAEVDRALAAGRSVVFTRDTSGHAEAELVQETWREGSEQAVDRALHPLDAVMVPWDEATQGPAPASTILPTAVTTELGLEVEIRDLRFVGDVDEATETRITEAVGGVVDGTYTYVERGYVRPDEATVVLLVLGGLGGLLMLGGTLTATFLALSDARPDLATLSAVGAAPRTRRRVAAAYAIVVGLVGSVLGAVVGFIPGVAISRPLTSVQMGPAEESGPYLAIPWLLIAVIVLALPLLTAAVVGLTARSRLPLVARLD
jgi:putative ABC transport system permease protein